MARRSGTVAFVALASGAALLAGGDAVRADPLAALGGESVEVSADQLEVDVGAGTATLVGNVRLARGELKVACPRIEVKYDEQPRVTWARGVGGVQADIKGVHAEAPEVELDLARHTLDLRGGVRLTRGQGWLQAEQASIDTRSAKVTLKDVRGAIPVARPAP